MNRRDFLKTIAGGAVAAMVPLPGPKTYFIERTYTDSGDQITISGVPQQVMWDLTKGAPSPAIQSWWTLKPGAYEYEELNK